MSFFEYLSYSWDHLLELAIGHAVVVAISLAIAVAIGVTLGVLVYRRERAANVLLAVTSTFLTIPSLALFGIFHPHLQARLQSGGRGAGHVRPLAHASHRRCP